MGAAHDEDFREFVAARSQRLLSTAYLLTGDRDLAEDLLQAALLRAYRHWRRLTAAGDPEAYIRRILVNQRISWWRRRRLDEVSIPEYHGTIAGVTDDPSAALAERDRVWQALRGLPPRTRAVVVLRYWEDMSEADTAEQLGCTVGTVKSLGSRGLARLRDLLDADGSPPAPATGPSIRTTRRGTQGAQP
jgi:RNA polymerase sigma-70 factor (sigma-E family)